MKTLLLASMIILQSTASFAHCRAGFSEGSLAWIRVKSVIHVIEDEGGMSTIKIAISRKQNMDEATQRDVIYLNASTPLNATSHAKLEQIAGHIQNAHSLCVRTNGARLSDSFTFSYGVEYAYQLDVDQPEGN